MDKKDYIASSIEKSLENATAIIDLARVASEGESARRIGIADGSIARALWVAMDAIADADNSFDEYRAIEDAERRGPRAA